VCRVSNLKNPFVVIDVFANLINTQVFPRVLIM